MKSVLTFLGWAWALCCATSVSACLTSGPLSLSPAVMHADVVVAGTLTGLSTYQRTRIGRSDVSEVSTVVFDVEHVLSGDAPSTLEFIALGNTEMMVRNLGNQFVVALLYADGPVFEPDDRVGDISALPILLKTSCGTYMFAMGGPNDLSSGFLFEIYDGDGDPAEEAIVFDRYLRGHGLY